MPAQPGGRDAPAMTSAPAASATFAVSSVERSSTTSTSTTPRSEEAAASSGPIRSASFRAGTTTEIVADGPSPAGGSGVTGGRMVVAFMRGTPSEDQVYSMNPAEGRERLIEGMDLVLDADAAFGPREEAT